MTRRTVCFVYVVFSVCVGSVLPASVPAGLSICKFDDPKIDSCLAKSIENGIRLFKKGLPDLNIGPIEPFEGGSQSIGAGTGAVLFQQNYYDLKISGSTDLTVTKAHFNAKKKILTFTSLHPNLTFKGRYTLNGKLLVFQVYGKGPFSVSFDNIQIRQKYEFEPTTKNGEVYYKIKTFGLEMLPEKVRYNFEELFDNNKALSDNINVVLNDEWKTIFDDIKPNFEATCGKIIKEYAQAFFDKIPAKELFPIENK